MARMRLAQAAWRLPRMLYPGRIEFDFDGIPQVAERLSLRRRVNLLKAGVDEALGRRRLLSIPPIIQIEPTTACSLRCPLCPTGSGILPRKTGRMSWRTFETLLRETGDFAIAYYLFCFGEPFMHPDLLRMVRACTDRGLLTFTTTNGHHVKTMEKAFEVIDSGLTTLLVAVDGSTQEIYSAYRKRGDLEVVKRGISLVRRARDRRGVRHPYLAVRSVVSRHNEADLPAIEKLAGELGADMYTVKSLGCLPSSEDYESYEPGGTEFRRFEHDGEARKKQVPFRCQFPFRQPIVFWDGTVVGCEYDHDLERAFGRIGERPFAEIWNSANARALRREVRSDGDRAPFCTRCPYEDRVQDGSDLYCRELACPPPGST